MWEYTLFTFDTTHPLEQQVDLNYLGDQGWELCGITKVLEKNMRGSELETWIFKKRKDQE